MCKDERTAAAVVGFIVLAVTLVVALLLVTGQKNQKPAPAEPEKQEIVVQGDIEIHMGDYILKCKKVTIHD